MCLFLGVVSAFVLRSVSGWAPSSSIVDWSPVREHYGSFGLFAIRMTPAISRPKPNMLASIPGKPKST